MDEKLERARRVYEMAPPVEEQSAYDHLPVWLDPYIPGLYKQESEEDPIVWAKLFTPDSSWTWYVTESTNGDCFGYVIGFDSEWGCFSLVEMAGVRGPLGLPIERDLWFRPQRASQVIERESQLEKMSG